MFVCLLELKKSLNQKIWLPQTNYPEEVDHPASSCLKVFTYPDEKADGIIDDLSFEAVSDLTQNTSPPFLMLFQTVLSALSSQNACDIQ